jgi:glycosyltransferase involved in cell wall biosynthesis
MRVVIATVQVPFIYGGAEMHAEQPRNALVAHGHEAAIVAVPFKWYPPERILDHMLACRLLDLTESAGTQIDRLIGLKFPAYLIPHPNKVMWLLHQHRQAYELWKHSAGDLVHFSNGVDIREAIRQADRNLIPEAKAVYANSANVTKRLKDYCGIDSVPLYHPPPAADEFYCAGTGDYLFFPSRIVDTKRQALVVEALGHTRQPVSVYFAGAPDHPNYMEELREKARKLKIEHRVTWLGNVSEDEKRRLYAQALGVVFPPVDEDYGYVTLEAMLSSKPVITCKDSGGPLEFVVSGETGLVCEPTPEGLAAAMDRLWEERSEAKNWGVAGRERYHGMGITWSKVVKALLS